MVEFPVVIYRKSKKQASLFQWVQKTTFEGCDRKVSVHILFQGQFLIAMIMAESNVNAKNRYSYPL